LLLERLRIGLSKIKSRDLFRKIAFAYDVNLAFSKENRFFKRSVTTNSTPEYIFMTEKISVVVPCFNHERYLRRRLDSIYNQSYGNLEVILLDDCSTDGSAAILAEYCQKYSEMSRLFTNKENTGSPFMQWAKGIELAKGDVVWVAESDDYCGPDFLAKMIEAFKDEGVALAFTAPEYVDDEGQPTAFQFDQYTRAISHDKWDQDYVVQGAQEVASALGIRNTIPNASAVLFRRETALPHITDPFWRKMRILGDWLFYLRLAQNNKIAFVKSVESYFHHAPSSHSAMEARTQGLLAEHAAVVNDIYLLYPELSPEVLPRNYAFVADHLKWAFGEKLPPFVNNWNGITMRLHNDLQRHVGKLELTINEMSEELRRRNEETLRTSEKVVELRSELDQCTNQCAYLKKCLAALYSSTSWTITKPLRIIKTLCARKLDV
jgi:glycosyltransferase involved in cell wall biosynthesis